MPPHEDAVAVSRQASPLDTQSLTVVARLCADAPQRKRVVNLRKRFSPPRWRIDKKCQSKNGRDGDRRCHEDFLTISAPHLTSMKLSHSDRKWRLSAGSELALCATMWCADHASTSRSKIGRRLRLITSCRKEIGAGRLAIGGEALKFDGQ